MHPDLICFSHLRWDFVYQRPQHLMSRAALTRQVLFVEEPVARDIPAPTLSVRQEDQGVTVIVPQVPAGTYPFYCLPHRAYDMRGVLVIK